MTEHDKKTGKELEKEEFIQRNRAWLKVRAQAPAAPHPRAWRAWIIQRGLATPA